MLSSLEFRGVGMNGVAVQTAKELAEGLNSEGTRADGRCRNDVSLALASIALVLSSRLNISFRNFGKEPTRTHTTRQ